jgi:hypothetical protein
VNAPRSLPAESAAKASGAADPLAAPLALAEAWAGDALALLLGGSHASGTAAWATLDDRRVCLSDLDVYAVVADRARQRAALARARAGRDGLRRRLLAMGFAAPLEVSFPRPEDLAGLPARPATLELARHGVAWRGDPAWLARVPRWRAADVPAEEIQLLLENRAFELLAAWPDLASPSPLARLLARHAVLKCALDVVRVEALARGEYPDGAAALAAGAAPGTAGRPALLAAALAWRAAGPRAPAPEAARCEWHAAVVDWCSCWRARVGPATGDALRHARRARLRRRLRLALAWPDRSGLGPPPVHRLRHALRGTPQHRVNAAAAVLLLAAADGAPDAGAPALGDAARGALAALGLAGAAGAAGWPEAARRAVEAWDRWVLDGQRTAEPA